MEIRNRIGAVFVHVSDMPRAVEFYGRLLGLEIDDSFHEGHIAVVPTGGGSSLVLDSINKDLFRPHDKPIFSFQADDIDRAHAAVTEHGIAIDWPIERTGGVSFFTIRDPDGNMLMICQTVS